MKLADYRKLKGYSRAKLGELLLVTGVTVWRWETGRSIPKPLMIRAIAHHTQGAVSADDHHRAAEGRAA